MSEYTPQVGHRVRVVLEGEVLDVDTSGWDLADDTGLQRNWFRHDATHVVSVERLPDPEPEWQPGDVVLDAKGRTFGRMDAARYMWVWLDSPMGVQGSYSDDQLVRPLTLLVRDGKRWEQ